VTLSGSSDVPVGSLAIYGAIGPLLATVTKFCWDTTNLKAKGAVPSVGRTNIL